MVNSSSLHLPFEKSYEPNLNEETIYAFWEKNRCFEANVESKKPPYAIMIPPPNVTGVLHMGHALTNTIQDILIRWRRMSGDNALWLPGTDHAGIATQNVVERDLLKREKKTRHDLGRDAFLKLVWAWKEESARGIKHQLKKLGSSFDWTRERFTLDNGFSRAVREVFVSLYEKNLLYKGERMINWCPRCQTALSDLEVVPKERKGNLWHLRYEVRDENNHPAGTLVVATTRPETLLGDVAVALHPDDPRYQKYKAVEKSGEKFKIKIPLTERFGKIIFDDTVDPAFGTGAVKITPAHDFNDYEMGVRHQLPFISVIQKDGKMSPGLGEFSGLSVKEAREKVVAQLEIQGLLEKVEPHLHKVGVCQRCETVAEPLISMQWFVKMEGLAARALKVVADGEIEFRPENWTKTYNEWLLNIRDWCVSRQLWWGHQIPAWECGRCHSLWVKREAPTTCEKCHAPASELLQDPDVLDTWFSSALWPFGTLGWPEKTPDFVTFYPNAVLETGFDILFFWVARMIMLGLEFTDQVPFKKVFLHAMVRDEKGEKMSKSKGNVIDPLDAIAEHGTDALRFALASMAGQNRDVKLSLDRVEGYRAFANKLWNATKFFQMHFENKEFSPVTEPPEGLTAWIAQNAATLPAVHQAILHELHTVAERVNRGFEKFEMDQVCQALYQFSWMELCDWYIEAIKSSLNKKEARAQALLVFRHVLEETFKLLHPVMPFVTETLWAQLPWRRAAVNLWAEPVFAIMVQAFPTADAEILRATEKGRTAIAVLKRGVESIRNFRGENSLHPRKDFSFRVRTESKNFRDILTLMQDDLLSLTRTSGFSFEDTPASDFDAVISLPEHEAEFRIDLRGLIEVADEQKRLGKEIEKCRAEVARLETKLAKPEFIDKAPLALVEKERKALAEWQQKAADLQSASTRLEKFRISS